MNKNLRITNLDFIRGVALLGILVMNVISFGLPISAYYNHSSYGVENTLDWIVVIISSIFFDSKMMGLFSMLFGAGMVLFYDRAKEKTTWPLLLSFWRNFLLLCFGLIHITIWDGDILTVYGICAMFIIATRMVKIKNIKSLIFITSFFLVSSTYITNYFDSLYDENGNLSSEYLWIEVANKGSDVSLGKFWFPDTDAFSNVIGLWFVSEGFIRAFTLMVFGMLLYRLGILNGTKEKSFYTKLMFYGFGIGLPLSVYSIYILITGEYSPGLFLPSRIVNTLSIIPMVTGYVGLLTILNKQIKSQIAERLRACGRMAFTNYIVQTLFGTLVFTYIFDLGELTRSQLILFVLIVWIFQYFWSKVILDKWKFGPLEWFWRKLTYFFI